MHKLVDEQHERYRDANERQKLREHGVGTFAQVGDYVLVTRPPEKGVSTRFQRKHFDEIYQVVQAHGEGAEAKAYTVCDSKGRQEDLGFSNPVAFDRITPVDLLPLSHPEGETYSNIAINVDGTLRYGKISGQRLDGQVYVDYDDNPGDLVLVDLTKSNYHWVT